MGDMLTECKHCGKPVARAATACPHCGGPTSLGALQAGGDAASAFGCVLILIAALVFFALMVL